MRKLAFPSVLVCSTAVAHSDVLAFTADVGDALQEIAQDEAEDKPTVFASDAVIAHLMAVSRAVDAWCVDVHHQTCLYTPVGSWVLLYARVCSVCICMPLFACVHIVFVL
jgi:hypothetical protein